MMDNTVHDKSEDQSVDPRDSRYERRGSRVLGHPCPIFIELRAFAILLSLAVAEQQSYHHVPILSRPANVQIHCAGGSAMA